MDVRRIPVIIVGAGVGGLATSALLAKHRIPSLLVEKRREVFIYPKARNLSFRTLEILRGLGVGAEVHAIAEGVSSMVVKSTLNSTEQRPGLGRRRHVLWHGRAQSRACRTVLPAEQIGTDPAGLCPGSRGRSALWRRAVVLRTARVRCDRRGVSWISPGTPTVHPTISSRRTVCTARCAKRSA